MALIGGKIKRDKSVNKEEKVLEVDASMQGDFCFKDPVNLKINGKFEGTLNTRGNLIINKNALVNAEIKGENIQIAGSVNGNIYASESLTLKSSAKVTGDVNTNLFSIEKGAIFNGKCEMGSKEKKMEVEEADFISKDLMNLDELSNYIDIDKKSILKLIKEKKIPAQRIEDDWRFNRQEIDNWISNEDATYGTK